MAVTDGRPLRSAAEPKSQHVADAAIQPFLQPNFDPADHLNAAFPALSLSSTASRTARTAPLPEVSTQLQTYLSQLNAQTLRLSSTLTQLTDEIIRSGSRLAYEVEVLRGETLGLTDALESGLKGDIESLTGTPTQQPERREEEVDSENTAASDPEFLTRLRTLTAVRSRLDSVIQVFGSAMKWPVAPSDVSVASSLVSVSAPDQGGDGRSQEEKGKQYVEELRNEINVLLLSGPEGIEAATRRLEELQTLVEVWKGTAEEKARLKVVDGVQKVIEEKQRTAARSTDGGRRPGGSPARSHDYRYGSMDAPKAGNESGSGGYGFLQNLRNLKNDVYVD